LMQASVFRQSSPAGTQRPATGVQWPSLRHAAVVMQSSLLVAAQLSFKRPQSPSALHAERFLQSAAVATQRSPTNAQRPTWLHCSDRSQSGASVATQVSPRRVQRPSFSHSRLHCAEWRSSQPPSTVTATAQTKAHPPSAVRQKSDRQYWRRRTALGGREAASGFGVKPQRNEECRGCEAAPQSGAKSPVGLLAGGTRPAVDRGNMRQR
jgi:hypothetical protein